MQVFGMQKWYLDWSLLGIYPGLDWIRFTISSHFGGHVAKWNPASRRVCDQSETNNSINEYVLRLLMHFLKPLSFLEATSEFEGILCITLFLYLDKNRTVSSYLPHHVVLLYSNSYIPQPSGLGMFKR